MFKVDFVWVVIAVLSENIRTKIDRHWCGKSYVWCAMLAVLDS